MQIGERMSNVVDMDKIIIDQHGEGYEDDTAFMIEKPLDTGRLLYARLRRTLEPEVEVEVWFNHFDNSITAEITGSNGLVNQVTFPDVVAPRHEKIDFIDRIIRMAKEVTS